MRTVDDHVSVEGVLEVVREAFQGDEGVVVVTEAMLSVAVALMVSGIEGCPALLLEGPAASRKTTVLGYGVAVGRG